MFRPRTGSEVSGSRTVSEVSGSRTVSEVSGSRIVSALSGSQIVSAAVVLVCASILVSCRSTSPPGHPQAGGTFRLAVADLGSLDPAMASTPEQYVVATALFSTLVSVAPAQGTAGGVAGVGPTVVSNLAASWTASPDLTQWDFVLRPGAHLSNGRPITADDVKFSLERVVRHGSPSPGADLLSDVVGDADFNQTGSAAELIGVTAPSPSDVHVALTAPFADFPTLLANPVFGIVPPEAVGVPNASVPSIAGTLVDSPVTSGPYVVESRIGRTLTLSRAVGARTFADRIVVSTYGDDASAYAAFNRGSSDWALVPPELTDSAVRTYGRGAFAPLAAGLYYGFNLHDPIWIDRRLREAVAKAVDRSEVIAKAYGSSAMPLTSVVPFGVAGHQADPCGSPCSYDPVGARQLVQTVMASDGLTTPPTIAVDYEDTPTQENVAHVIKRGLLAIGLRVALRPKPLPDFQADAVAGRVELFRLGWVAPTVTQDAFLESMFASGSASNLTGFSDSQVDQVLMQARSSADPARRASEFAAAERLIMSDVPIIPLVQFATHAVVARRVHGLATNGLGFFDPAAVWLSR